MTITEIAELAGVSRATVSRYLNDGYVSKSNKEKIQKVIDETGYVPSMYAQTLRTKKTNLIGVIIPRVNSEAVGRVVDGISQTLGEAGYDLLLGNTNLDTDKELEYLRIFERNQVEGIILLATVLTTKHIKLMKALKVPVVVLGQEVDGFTSIFHDDYKASYMMTEHLIGQGYRQIGMLGVDERDKAVGYERKRGYQDALLAHGLEVDTNRIEIGGFGGEAGSDGMRKLLDKECEIDSVFCVTDTISIGAIRYLREQGIGVPNTIGIGSIGNYRIAEAVVPSLTTMHYHYKTSGIEAARLVLEQAADKDSIIRKVKLDVELYARESSCP